MATPDLMLKTEVDLGAGLEKRDLGEEQAQSPDANKTTGGFLAADVAVYGGIGPEGTGTVLKDSYIYTGLSFSYGLSPIGHGVPGSNNADTQSFNNLDGRWNLGVAYKQLRIQVGTNFLTSTTFNDGAKVGIQEDVLGTSIPHTGNDNLEVLTHGQSLHGKIFLPIIAPASWNGSALGISLYVDHSTKGTYTTYYAEDPTSNSLVWHGASNTQYGFNFTFTSRNLAQNDLIDKDGDGWFRNDPDKLRRDCDDSDPARNPGIPGSCEDPCDGNDYDRVEKEILGDPDTGSKGKHQLWVENNQDILDTLGITLLEAFVTDSSRSPTGFRTSDRYNGYDLACENESAHYILKADGKPLTKGNGQSYTYNDLVLEAKKKEKWDRRAERLNR